MAAKKKKAAKAKTPKKAKTARKVKPIPEGYHTVTPAFGVKGCDKAIEFLKVAFGAKVLDMFQSPDGKVMHCEMKIGDSKIMCGEALEPAAAWNIHAMLYVKDCDAVFAQAIAAGAKVKNPLTDQFYGDRNGRVVDPFGNEWNIGTHKEDVSRKEQMRRFQEMMSKGKGGAPA